jgi:cytochrome c biogenesis protein CcmG, thiol:disulfide interchange protein DsbE
MALEPGTPSAPPPIPPPRRSLIEQPLVRLALAALLLGVLGGVALAVRSSRGGDQSPAAVVTGTPPSDAGLGPIGGDKPVLQQPAPDFALRDADGQVVKLSDYRGKVVWVNFWATWCIPCRKELPDIQTLSDELSAKGLVVLTVNYKEGVADAKDFFAQHDVSLPLLLDTSGSVYDEYKLTGLPDSFFVDRDGILRAQQYGSFTPETMRQRLAAAGLQ